MQTAEQIKPGFTIEEIQQVYRAGNHIAAVKMLRAETGCDLREAVDALARPGALEEMPTFKAYRLRRSAQMRAVPLLDFVRRVGALNRDAGEIGPGMLASLVDDARAIITEVEKE